MPLASPALHPPAPPPLAARRTSLAARRARLAMKVVPGAGGGAGGGAARGGGPAAALGGLLQALGGLGGGGDGGGLAAARAAAPRWAAAPGAPAPLGASPAPGGGVNFAVAAPAARAVALVLFGASGSPDAEDEPLAELPMHRSPDGVWTARVPGLAADGSVLYGYRADGDAGDAAARWHPARVLLDPYARGVQGRARFGARDAREAYDASGAGGGSRFLGTLDWDSPAAREPFDWGAGHARPEVPAADLVVYEVPVRAFTAHASSGLLPDARGSFAGFAARGPGLVRALGANAVELLPVFEYDELEFRRRPNARDHMVNVWGYSHLSFFAPMSRFAAGGGGPAAAARELKELVRACHAEGVEVILDVVYNHTAEGGDDDPYPLSWRGLDAGGFYMQNPGHPDPAQRLVNHSGCGNTVAANAPRPMAQILDSLRWWAREFRVDGFRFDLASALCRDAAGAPLDAPPLVRAVAKDPELARLRLIAEPWDCGGLYQVGSFPNWDVWAEWNGRFRDDVRRFVRGDAGLKAALATRLAGSADMYAVNERRPYHSINFVVAHDGFTLADLVSYNDKHNEANGEGNRDGSNDNFSWNCGAEGLGGPEGGAPAAVAALRARQMRNLHLALVLAQGTPMILSGDEYAATRRGNNNWYGHDAEWTHFRWDLAAAAAGVASPSGFGAHDAADPASWGPATATGAGGAGWFRFYAGALNFRRECPLLRRGRFLGPADVTWHERDWGDAESRFLAFTLHDGGEWDAPRGGGRDLFAAFNAHAHGVDAPLPAAPAGRRWARLADTALPAPRDWTPGGNAGINGAAYGMAPYSAILLVAKADDEA